MEQFSPTGFDTFDKLNRRRVGDKPHTGAGKASQKFSLPKIFASPLSAPIGPGFSGSEGNYAGEFSLAELPYRVKVKGGHH